MENKLEIMTHKSGKFVFSAEYDRLVIDPLVAEVQTLADFMMDLRVFPMEYRIDEDLIIRSIMSTAAIEGNPLTEEEVGRIVKGGEVSGVYQQEISNLKYAYDAIEKFSSDILGDEFKLDENMILFSHERITENIPHDYNMPGYYRSEKVKVGDKQHGGIYTPPKCLDDIKMLMKAFEKWFKFLELHPFVKAFIFHYYFAKIHPFSDGNGRTARVLEGFYLANAGYGFFMKELSNYYYKQIDDYYRAFSDSHRTGDVTHFLLFCLNVMRTALYDRKKEAIEYAKKFALRSHLLTLLSFKVINKRQFDLLDVLMIHDIAFSKKNLPTVVELIYAWFSERTLSNDLNHLISKNLLIKENDNYRININYLKPAI